MRQDYGRDGGIQHLHEGGQDHRYGNQPGITVRTPVPKRVRVGIFWQNYPCVMGRVFAPGYFSYFRARDKQLFTFSSSIWLQRPPSTAKATVTGELAHLLTAQHRSWSLSPKRFVSFIVRTKRTRWGSPTRCTREIASTGRPFGNIDPSRLLRILFVVWSLQGDRRTVFIHRNLASMDGRAA